MFDKKPSLLIADNEASMRMFLLEILTESGYAVRSATDAFSAFVEICHLVPDFLIADLSLPGNSDFEFLRVVRSQFPSIRVIAMSSAYSGDQVPCGASADAFYEKGTSLRALLSTLKFLPPPQRWAQQLVAAPAPVWISSSAGQPRNADA
jgi:CheY-like chemotaxis protein